MNLKSELRTRLLSLYGINISGGSIHYSEIYSSFVITLPDYTILIAPANPVDKKESMAKIMWADDIRNFRASVCEVVVSNKNNLCEYIDLDAIKMGITVYNRERGKMLMPQDITPIFLINAGEMLSSIHNISKNQQEEGICFKISSVYDYANDLLKNVASRIGQDLANKISRIIAEPDYMEKTPDNYGVCYGDFVLSKLIVDINNIYLFDYNSCVYAPYGFDIACFILSVLEEKYLLKRTTEDVLENNLIPWIKMGYYINKPFEGDFAKMIHDMIYLKAAISILGISSNNELSDIQLAKLSLYSDIILEEDIYGPIDRYRKILLSESI